MKHLFRLWIPGMCFWCDECRCELIRYTEGYWAHPKRIRSWLFGKGFESACPNAGKMFKAAVELEEAK